MSIKMIKQKPVEIARTTLMLKHPFTCIVAGPTSSGKTIFVRNLIASHVKTIHIKLNNNLRVLWCYGVFQEKYNDPIPACEVNYVSGIPSEEDIANFMPDLIVLDDLMTESSNAVQVSQFFTRGSHHQGYSVVMIVQNLFNKGKEMRNISLNSQIIVLMKNRRDLRQINTLAQQIYPGKSKDFVAVYLDATKEPFSYLLIDLQQTTPEALRLRTQIFEDSSTQIIYKI